MKAEIKCSGCCSGQFTMLNTVATSEVVVYCAQCGKRLGQFSSYGFTEEEAKKDDASTGH